MSYLAQLQEMRRQPDAIGGAIIGLGQLAGGLGQAQQDAQDRQQKLEDRLREIATGKASALQKVGQAYADSNNFAAAGKLLPDFTQSFNQAYGTDLPTAPIVGSPVMARGMEKVEQQGPPQVPGGKLLVDVPTPYMYDTGKREFDEGAQAAIRGGLLLPKVKPETFDLSPGQTRYEQMPGGAPKAVATADFRPASSNVRPVQNPVTGEWFTPAPGMRTDVRPQSESNGPRPVQNPVTGEWFVPTAGMKTDPPPRMVAITNPDGSVTMTPTSASAPVTQKPAPAPKVRTAVELQNEAEAEIPSSSKNFVPKSIINQREKWKRDAKAKDAAAYDDWKKRNPGGGGGTANPNPPGGGKAAAARRGVLNIAPPSKYEDTALLPEWESHVQAALKVAPGVEISSRARSRVRNAQAKPGGGAPDSWHMHRQAFDVVKYTPAQREQLRKWAASEGLHMIDEGNHLHFEPARVSDAGQAPALVAFYEKHGIKPGAANA